MFCNIPNDFFLPDGKNSRLSKIINTRTFGRLTPDGNEGVGVEIEYLEHAYGTRYYVVDQVNGNINAIHDSLESTEFTGHFSPFNLDELELKVCRIADFTGHFSPFNLDELELKVCRIADNYEGQNDPTKDIVAPQNNISNNNKTTKLHDSAESSRQQNIEDLTDMGVITPNYSPIHAIRNTAT